MSEYYRSRIMDMASHFYADVRWPELFIPGETYIPVAKECIDAEDLCSLIDACLDMRFAGGPKTAQFEREIAKQFGRETSGLLVNSGSSANLVAISALGLKPGDEVITAACAFPTTVNPIVQCGAIPVFVDVDLETLNVKPESVMAAYTDKTKAVVLAHTLGNPFRADIIAEWCEAHGLMFVEDCCDALGAEINGKRVGSFGDYATCSFYPAHHISMGEGGVVISKNGRLRRIACSVRDWGRDCWCEPGQDNTCNKRFCQQQGQLPYGYDHKYTYSRLGYNLKATELQATLGLSQLKRVESFIASRRSNWNKFQSRFESFQMRNNTFLIQPTSGTKPSWFGFGLLAESNSSRNHILSHLEINKIGTRLVFSGNLTKQPAYQSVNYRVHGDLSNTDEIMNRAFWIGCHPGITDKMIDYMVESLKSIF